MDAEEALLKLKAEYPEIEEHILQEALRNNNYDFIRANESLKARFYNEDAGIPQEQSFWASLSAPFGVAAAPQTSQAQSSWDLSLDSLADGVNSIGAQLLLGVEVVADTIGSLGDLIPDLIFGAEDDEYADGQGPPGSSKDKDQVVVGASRGNLVKKRGTTGPKVETPPPAIARQEELDHATDEEGDDWTKED